METSISTSSGGGEFPGSGSFRNRRFIPYLRRNSVPLIVITALCVFSLTFTYLFTETTTTLHFNRWSRSPPSKHHNFQLPIEHPPKIRCPLKKLDPFAPRMLALINMTIFRSNYSCADDPALGIFKGAAFHIEKGHLLVRDVKFPDDVKCCWKVVTKVQDVSVRIHECTELRNEVNQTTAIQPPIEVVMVTCNNSKSENYYTDAFQLFQKKPEVEKRIKTWQEEQLKSKMKVNDDGRLSVIVFGLDTVSQMNFERSMPLSKSYLDNDLEAVNLKGYNKVAGDTMDNVMPLMTGLTGDELWASCVTPSMRFFNCPFIWNTFASHGYRTAFFDEQVSCSLFNYIPYRNAFGDYPDGPTDYFGRPYTLLMGTRLNFTGFCHGPRLSFQHLLDNVKTMANMFNTTQRPYFNFIWSTAISHKSLSLSTLPRGDNPLLETLKYLHEKGHFNHTALFLLADHGRRQHDDIYEAMIENRMPLAYIVLPPWFSQRYPKAFENLRWNGENSVASHFDMYKTLQDMLDLDRFESDSGTWRANRYFHTKKREIATRGQSLFELNPQGRNCEFAGIPPMWCLCHEMALPLKNDSFLAVSAAEALIEEVNRKAKKIDSLKCERLHLAEIVNATAILFDKETWAKPECRRVISNEVSQNVSTSSCTDTIYISLRIRGSPHDPVFQTMMVRNSTRVFSTPSEIAREDWYSEKGHCVENNLRRYCVCKDFE